MLKKHYNQLGLQVYHLYANVFTRLTTLLPSRLSLSALELHQISHVNNLTQVTGYKAITLITVDWEFHPTPKTCYTILLYSQFILIITNWQVESQFNVLICINLIW